jgi:hypothetical protein
MTTRTVKVLGWGTGSAEIIAILDGETVFSNSVDLVEMTTDNESVETAPALFTFEIPMGFAGTKQMVITVAGAPVRFGQIVANYTEVAMGAITYSSGADIYADIIENDGYSIADPRGDEVIIDGQTHKVDRLIARGTWHWTVNPGSTFEHDIIVSKAGLEE